VNCILSAFVGGFFDCNNMHGMNIFKFVAKRGRFSNYFFGGACQQSGGTYPCALSTCFVNFAVVSYVPADK
jgi:hypothetical protein